MANSFDEVIDKEPERFVGYAFNENKDISDFSEFKNALNSYFQDSHAPFQEQHFIDLFESEPCKERLKEKLSTQDYERTYGDGIIVERQAISKTRMVTLTGRKVNVKSYKTRTGKVIKSGVRLKARKWSGVELKFIRARKVKGITPSKIFSDYNKHFSNSPRSKSSLKTRFYRL